VVAGKQTAADLGDLDLDGEASMQLNTHQDIVARFRQPRYRVMPTSMWILASDHTEETQSGQPDL
jgi:hypothetical protein